MFHVLSFLRNFCLFQCEDYICEFFFRNKAIHFLVKLFILSYKLQEYLGLRPGVTGFSQVLLNFTATNLVSTKERIRKHQRAGIFI